MNRDRTPSPAFYPTGQEGSREEDNDSYYNDHPQASAQRPASATRSVSHFGRVLGQPSSRNRTSFPMASLQPPVPPGADFKLEVHQQSQRLVWAPVYMAEEAFRGLRAPQPSHAPPPSLINPSISHPGPPPTPTESIAESYDTASSGRHSPLDPTPARRWRAASPATVAAYRQSSNASRNNLPPIRFAIPEINRALPVMPFAHPSPSTKPSPHHSPCLDDTPPPSTVVRPPSSTPVPSDPITVTIDFSPPGSKVHTTITQTPNSIHVQVGDDDNRHVIVNQPEGVKQSCSNDDPHALLRVVINQDWRSPAQIRVYPPYRAPPKKRERKPKAPKQKPEQKLAAGASDADGPPVERCVDKATPKRRQKKPKAAQAQSEPQLQPAPQPEFRSDSDTPLLDAFISKNLTREELLDERIRQLSHRHKGRTEVDNNSEKQREPSASSSTYTNPTPVGPAPPGMAQRRRTATGTKDDAIVLSSEHEDTGPDSDYYRYHLPPSPLLRKRPSSTDLEYDDDAPPLKR